VDLAGGCGGTHRVGGKRLGDGDEEDRIGIASDPAGRARDARANVGQPGLHGGRVEDYFFGSDPGMPFAGAAFVPVGARLRYVWTRVPACARLPSFTSAIPSW